MTWQNKRVCKTRSPGQSAESKAIHQKDELLPARQDLQGQCQKVLQRAGKKSHHYPEPSLTRRGRDILEQNVGEQQDPYHYNDAAHWIQDQAKENKHVPTQEWSDVTTEETIEANRTSNWKAAGCDDVANFWFKQLTSFHPELASAYNNILKNPEQSSEWLTEGVTFLIPKSEDTENFKNYRPITCLPTMYKVLTSVITERAYIFLESINLLPKVQKGCRRRSYQGHPTRI